MANQYIPGVCNIGPEEIKRRRNFGVATLVITLALLLVLILTGVSPWWRLFVFFPAMMSASGFLQAHFSFCSGFAKKGIFNFGALGHTEAITDESSKTKDKKKGGRITLYAVLIGVVVAIVCVVI